MFTTTTTMPDHLSTKQVRRGDVVLVPFPNSDLRTAKLRPALIVQSNEIDSELSQVILAMISSNLQRVGRKPRILVVAESDIGKSSGLLFDSVIMTDNLATVLRSQITRVLGNIGLMTEIDDALRHSLGL